MSHVQFLWSELCFFLFDGGTPYLGQLKVIQQQGYQIYGRARQIYQLVDHISSREGGLTQRVYVYMLWTALVFGGC